MGGTYLVPLDGDLLHLLQDGLDAVLVHLGVLPQGQALQLEHLLLLHALREAAADPTACSPCLGAVRAPQALPAPGAQTSGRACPSGGRGSGQGVGELSGPRAASKGEVGRWSRAERPPLLAGPQPRVPRPRCVPGRAGPPPGAGLCAGRRWCWPAAGGPAAPAASPPPAPGCRGCSCPASPPVGAQGRGGQGRARPGEARAQAARRPPRRPLPGWRPPAPAPGPAAGPSPAAAPTAAPGWAAAPWRGAASACACAPPCSRPPPS